MLELIFAIFDSPPIACEGDDVNAKIMRLLVEESQTEIIINNTITDCIILWNMQKV